MPWLFLPAFILLTFDLPAFAGVRISLAVLQVPLAAWLGARHGRHGVAVVAAAAPFVFPRLSYEYLSLGGEIGFWMASMSTALIAASPLPLAERLVPIRDRRHFGTCLILGVLLPVSFDPIEAGTVEDFVVAFGSSLWPAFYMLLFLLGARRVPWALPIGIVGISAAVGWLIILQDWFDSRWLAYGTVSPAAMTAGLACFAVGRAVHRDVYGFGHDRMSARHPDLAIVLLMLLWAVPDSLSSIRLALDDLRWLHLFGSYYLLPLAAFYAGWTRGAAGVRFTVWLTLALILLRHLAEFFLDGSVFLVLNAEWLLIPYCYGALGNGARRGRNMAACSIRWRRDALLLAAIAVPPLAFELDTAEGALSALVFLALLLLAAARKKYGPRMREWLKRKLGGTGRIGRNAQAMRRPGAHRLSH